MGDGKLNTTDMIILQSRRNGDPTQNKHARQSEKWGREATHKQQGVNCILLEVSLHHIPWMIFFPSFYTSHVSDLKKCLGSTPHLYAKPA